MKINRMQITDKLSKLPIEEIAIAWGFQKREPKKITGLNFVLGFILMLHSGGSSLNDWAQKISKLIGKLVSKQALSNKLELEKETFAYRLLNAALRQSLKIERSVQPSSLFKFFRKVYVEDSTCLKMPACLACFFPGPHSSKGPCSSLRIQLRMDLKEESYEGFCLQPYRDVDQKYAGVIVGALQAGDLVIRDLGYWAIKTFRAIIQAKAYILSRYKYGTNCLDVDTKEKIDLLKELKKLDRKGIEVLDRLVLLGQNEQLPVRLVAVKVPQHVLLAKVRRAKKDRCQSINHSKEYMELLGWMIFITNVDPKIWTFKHLMKAYRLRWRIEIIFKCWKSKFKVEQLFANKASMTFTRAVMTCVLFLVYLTVFFVPWVTFFIHRVFQATQKWVSILKFADFAKAHFVELATAKNLSKFIPEVAHYCCYEKRKSRSNYLEFLYMLNLS